MDFTSLPPSIIDDLYEEPAKLEVLTFDDFLNLPLNDLYLKENGNDPASFAKYKPKVTEEKPEEKPEDSPTNVENSEESEGTSKCNYCSSCKCNYCSSAKVKSCQYCAYKHTKTPVFTPEELEILTNKKS